MLFIGYFEGIDSQRGIAWRCADSMALRSFLGLEPTEATPVHASMSVIRQRLPEALFDEVFNWVLGLLDKKGLLKGKTLGIDATTLEADAAMRSIVRKDTGAGWKEYLRTLAKAEGIESPTDADLQRLDRARTEKKVSNEHWKSPSDPEARIARMKDGTTHLAYKAEHAVDLETEAIVAATVTSADRGDEATGAETLIVAQANLIQSGSHAAVQELVADKGCHDNRFLARCARWQVRTHIPDRKQKSRRWTDKPGEHETAFRANRCRVTGAKGKRLNRWRSERCERTFAHVCETGGGRRSHLRGLVNVTKSHVLRCAAFNLGLLLRKLFGMSKPRTGAGLFPLFLRLWTALVARIRTRTQFQPAKHSDCRSKLTDPSILSGLRKHRFFDGLLAIWRLISEATTPDRDAWEVPRPDQPGRCARSADGDRKSKHLNSSHHAISRMPSSA